MNELFMDGWNPESVDGSTNGTWGRKDDHRDGMTGPEICWDPEGSVPPMAFIEMSEQEQEVCLVDARKNQIC